MKNGKKILMLLLALTMLLSLAACGETAEEAPAEAEKTPEVAEETPEVAEETPEEPEETPEEPEEAAAPVSEYGRSNAEATGYVDRETLKAAVLWCKEQYKNGSKPEYEIVKEQLGGVDGKKFESSWTDELHKYMWKVEGSPNGKDYILVSFTVESDGTELLKQDQYDPDLLEP